MEVRKSNVKIEGNIELLGCNVLCYLLSQHIQKRKLNKSCLSDLIFLASWLPSFFLVMVGICLLSLVNVNSW